MKNILLSLLITFVIALIFSGIYFTFLAPTKTVETPNISNTEVNKNNEELPDDSIVASITEQYSQKYNRPIETIIIETEVDTGTFAKGIVRFSNELSGGIWFGAKTASGWELAFDGNGIVPCDISDKYDFPNDIIPQCIDTTNENNLIQR